MPLVKYRRIHTSVGHGTDRTRLIDFCVPPSVYDAGIIKYYLTCIAVRRDLQIEHTGIPIRRALFQPDFNQIFLYIREISCDLVFQSIRLN